MNASHNMQFVMSCALCKSDFKNAKQLCCLHTFCLHCLRKLHEERNFPKRLRCPTCKSATNIGRGGVVQLPNDYDKWDLNEQIQLYEANKKCGTCGKSQQVAKHCTACKVNLCDSCCATHTRRKGFYNHKLYPVKEIIRCPKHSQIVEHFCHECESLVCISCGGDHDSCNFVVSVDQATAYFHDKHQAALRSANLNVTAKNLDDVTALEKRWETGSKRLGKLSEILKEEFNKLFELKTLQTKLYNNRCKKLEAAKNNLRVLDESHSLEDMVAKSKIAVDEVDKLVYESPTEMHDSMNKFLQLIHSNISAINEVTADMEALAKQLEGEKTHSQLVSSSPSSAGSNFVRNVNKTFTRK